MERRYSMLEVVTAKRALISAGIALGLALNFNTWGLYDLFWWEILFLPC